MAKHFLKKREQKFLLGSILVEYLVFKIFIGYIKGICRVYLCTVEQAYWEMNTQIKNAVQWKLFSLNNVISYYQQVNMEYLASLCKCNI